MSAAASATRACCAARRSRWRGWHSARSPGALARGLPRASHRQRQLPRAPLPDHRLCIPRRQAAGDRLRRRGRCRRLLRLSDLGRRSRPRRSRICCPGPYVFSAYRCRSAAVATNKCPILPYRGVARTGICLAIEVIMDAIAREAGLEPYEVRLRNMVRPEQMPFDNVVGKHFDSGDHPECLRRAVDAIDLPAGARAPAARRSRRPADRRRACPSSSSRARTAPPCSRRGAVRWCPATSRRPSGSPPTATSRSGSAPTRTDRATKRPTRRSRMKSSASISTHQGLPGRHAVHPLLHRHLGLAFDGAWAAERSRRASRLLAARANRIGAWLLQADPAKADRRTARSSPTTATSPCAT